MGQSVPILCQPSICADSLKDYLSRHSHLIASDVQIPCQIPSGQQNILHFTSGCPDHVQETTKIFQSDGFISQEIEENWTKAILD